jgi:hypothetical protein
VADADVAQQLAGALLEAQSDYLAEWELGS